MNKEEIKEAKDFISYCAAMASEAESVEGFEVAKKLIEYYEEELERYMTYREIMLYS